MTWRSLQGEVVVALRAAGVAEPEAEARRIVAEAAGCSPAELVLIGGDEPTTLPAAHVARMLERRCAGEPLQYVLGSWGFRSLDLFVDGRVLIPRPETEVVTERALTEIDRCAADGHRPVVVDLGTGSGAIGLSVAVERERSSVWLTDASADALAVARSNLVGIGRAATRVQIVEGDWFEALPAHLVGGIDVIVSNPPYVADGDPLPEDVQRWEPAGALFAGSEGLDDLRRIVAEAPSWLAERGALVVELDPRQAGAVAGLAVDAGFSEVEVGRDLTGRDRLVVARR